jgi:RHS repeat-associated protein
MWVAGSTETMYYVHKDYLGSISAITDATGNLVESLSYDPWGRRRKATDWTDYNVTATLFDRGYIGHEHLPHFGLINMNGRVYDPFLARFLSPDPFVQAPGYTQNYNRYSYAWNNPLKYTDPSGYYIDGNRDYTPAHIYLDSGGSSGSWLSGNQMYMTGGFGPGSGRHWSDSFSRSWQVNILRMNARFFEYSYGTSVLNAHRLNKIQNAIRSSMNNNNASTHSGSAPTSHDATHQRYWQEGYGISFDGGEDGEIHENEQNKEYSVNYHLIMAALWFALPTSTKVPDLISADLNIGSVLGAGGSMTFSANFLLRDRFSFAFSVTDQERFGAEINWGFNLNASYYLGNAIVSHLTLQGPVTSISGGLGISGNSYLGYNLLGNTEWIGFGIGAGFYGGASYGIGRTRVIWSWP